MRIKKVALEIICREIVKDDSTSSPESIRIAKAILKGIDECEDVFTDEPPFRNKPLAIAAVYFDDKQLYRILNHFSGTSYTKKEITEEDLEAIDEFLRLEGRVVYYE